MLAKHYPTLIRKNYADLRRLGVTHYAIYRIGISPKKSSSYLFVEDLKKTLESNDETFNYNKMGLEADDLAKLGFEAAGRPRLKEFKKFFNESNLTFADYKTSVSVKIKKGRTRGCRSVLDSMPLIKYFAWFASQSQHRVSTPTLVRRMDKKLRKLRPQLLTSSSEQKRLPPADLDDLPPTKKRAVEEGSSTSSDINTSDLSNQLSKNLVVLTPPSAPANTYIIPSLPSVLINIGSLKKSKPPLYSHFVTSADSKEITPTLKKNTEDKKNSPTNVIVSNNPNSFFASRPTLTDTSQAKEPVDHNAEKITEKSSENDPTSTSCLNLGSGG